MDNTTTNTKYTKRSNLSKIFNILNCVYLQSPKRKNQPQRKNESFLSKETQSLNYLQKGCLLNDSKRMAKEMIDQIKADKSIYWNFTEDELKQLQQSSRRVTLMMDDDNGWSLFQRIFKYDREFTSLVKQKRNYTDQRIDQLFNTHAERLKNVIFDMISNANNIDYVFEVLVKLGEAHAAFNVAEIHIDLMICNFCDVVQRFDWEYWSTELQNSWLKFLKIILAIVLIGVNQATEPS